MRRIGVPTLIVLALLLAGCGEAADPTTTRVEQTAGSTTASSLPPTTSSTAAPPATTTTIEVELPNDLLVVGDWGSGTEPEGAVAGAMARYAEDNDVTAVLTTGDNFYSDDWEFLMLPYGWVAEAGIPFWITWGNHDIETPERIDGVNRAFADPPRWAVYEWGDVDVIVLDSNQITAPGQVVFFLDAMLDSANPTILVMHHPPYSCSHHGSTIEVVNDIVEVLDNDVFLVLSGHDHSYQRFEKDDVSYVVTGGGGRTLYPLSDCPSNHPERLAGAELHHFLALKQTPSEVELTAIDVNGDTIDQVTIPLP